MKRIRRVREMCKKGIRIAREMNKEERNMLKCCLKYEVKVEKIVEPVLIMHG
jgi:hypothetical protein